MNVSENLSSIRRQTVGQTFLQTGIYLELAEQNAKLSGLLEAAGRHANAADRQSAMLAQQQARKDMAAVWRKSILLLEDGLLGIQTLPENGFRALSFVMLRRFAEHSELLSSSSEISLQELREGKAVLASVATAESEFMAKVGASGSAEEFLEQKLREALPMVRQTAAAFRQYDAEMARIRDRLAGVLTVKDLHVLVEEEAKISKTVNAALDDWSKWFPEHDDLLALGQWQRQEAERPFLQKYPSSATHLDRDRVATFRENRIDALDDIQALAEKISNADDTCGHAVEHEIRRLQDMVTDRAALRERYRAALEAQNEDEVKIVRRKLGNFRLFADDETVAQLDGGFDLRSLSIEASGAALLALKEAVQNFTETTKTLEWPTPLIKTIDRALATAVQATVAASAQFSGSLAANQPAMMRLQKNAIVVRKIEGLWQSIRPRIKPWRALLFVRIAVISFCVLVSGFIVILVVFREEAMKDGLMPNVRVVLPLAVASVVIAIITPIGWIPVIVGSVRRKRSLKPLMAEFWATLSEIEFPVTTHPQMVNTASAPPNLYRQPYRSSDEKTLSGLCGGLAHRWGWKRIYVQSLLVALFIAPVSIAAISARSSDGFLFLSLLMLIGVPIWYLSRSSRIKVKLPTKGVPRRVRA